MTNIYQITTDRLMMRQWSKEDYVSFSALNADPDVMAFYPKTLSTLESNNMADILENLISERGWGFWAVETLANNQFIGFVGLHKPTYDLPVTPCVEIGWRLAKSHWGNGYATEAAKAALEFAFNTLKLSEVYSFASVSNQKSRAVMERINMKNTQKNFEHPIIPKGNPLREHVLYRIERKDWQSENLKTNMPATFQITSKSN